MPTKRTALIFENDMGDFYVIAKKEEGKEVYAYFEDAPMYYGFRVIGWKKDFMDASQIGARELNGLPRNFYKKNKAYVLHFKHTRVYQQVFEPIPQVVDAHGEVLYVAVPLEELNGEVK